MLDAPALPPPAIVAPAPREVSFGLVSGTAPPGTERIVVRAGAVVLADRPLRGRRFSVRVDLPPRLVNVTVTAVDGTRRSSSVVRAVHGLPRAAEPRVGASRLDPALARTVRALAGGRSVGVYVEDLRTGAGAAWNAKARFPAASTLKLAIAVTVMRELVDKPAAGSRLDSLLRAMLHRSDNEAANALETWIGGSTVGGSARVNETMRSLGLVDTDMYGGYETTRATAALPIPIRVERQPSWGAGKHTTAADLARLARAVYLGGAGKGPLLRLGVTGPEARHLLWLLAQVGDGGKLGRYLGPGHVLMHKAGWLPAARHDNGVVAHAGGAYVVAVMTYRAGGGDELAGRVSLAALRRLAGVG